MSDNQKDVAGVIVFPPLIPLTVLIVGVALDWLFPLAIISVVPFALRAVVGAALFVIGVSMLILAERAFERVGTNVNPFQPSLAIARGSIFGRLRNPMYVGWPRGFSASSSAFGLEWTFVLFVAGVFVLHFGVVLREERYLERKFGERLPELQEERAALRLQALSVPLPYARTATG